ncbi:hypothetical protein QBC39DRAFT_261703 [Podospora conica]|nr:hypothetical protein QBC39DRAFT_261703 [Schizothecium conicum]
MVGVSGFERDHREIDYLLPPNGPPKVVQPDLKIVRPDQRALTDQSYTDEFPMLAVAPGDFVAINYRENGHVSKFDKPKDQVYKPINRGTIYIYGTTDNDLTNTNLVDVHLAWTADGTGGDRKGKLLATRNFDDGQCFETEPDGGDLEGILTYRRERVNSKAAEKTPAVLCQSDVQVPFDAPIGSPYTIIWVWDWPTMSQAGIAVSPVTFDANDTFEGEPHVRIPEYYTGALDFKVVDPCDPSLGALKGPGCGAKGGQVKNVVRFVDQHERPLQGGIRAQMLKPFMVNVPQVDSKVTAATADPTDIPMWNLIGVTEVPPFPLAHKYLTPAPAAPEGPASPETSAAPETTISSSAAPPASTAAPNVPGVPELGNVLIVTVTVPAETVTVTETRSGATATATALSTGGTGTGTARATPRVRRRSGQWSFPRKL